MSDTRINRRNSRHLPILEVDTKKVIDTTINVLTWANELTDYVDSYVHSNDSSIRIRLYTVKCMDDTVSRVAIFTNENGSYYAAIEVENAWIEFTILDSTKNNDTIRFNTPTHQHFYADDDVLMECGDTPLSRLILGMMEAPHIGECVVYNALELAKEQGLV